MNKKYLIAISLILVLTAIFNSGCNNDSTGVNASTPLQAFVGGEEGLFISFMDGAPPKEVFDKDYPFDVNIRIVNKGEYSVAASNAQITLTGIDKDDFFTTPTPKSLGPMQTSEELLKIRKVANEIVEGTSTNVEFSSLQHQDEVTGDATFNLRANVCYVYQTKALSKICVLKDLLGKRGSENQICEVTGSKHIENSGAPVQIVSLEEAVTGSKSIAFTFVIKHVGDGAIFATTGSMDGTENKCSLETLSDKNKVKVIIDSGFSKTSGTLQCSGLTTGDNNVATGEVTLYGTSGNEERQIRCTVASTGGFSDLEKLVTITLDYDYNEYMDKSISVKHLG